MDIIEHTLDQKEVERRLDALAQRYRRAGNVGVQLLNAIGGQAEDLLRQLPESVRARLDTATRRALEAAMRAAHGSRSVVADQPSWLTKTLTTAMGAAGGAGGLPTALAELPVTTTVLLREIQSVAMRHGFDPAEDSVQFDCVRVFAAAGPLEEDDGSDLAFLATRMTVTGKAVSSLIARVAPRLSVVLGQKLAAQTVPVLGAVAGAATNYAYSSYYSEMAEVHFGLRRLAIEADQSEAALLEDLRQRVKGPAIKRM